MRIQHNVMAMNAYRNYTNNVAAMKSNLEKLSSGYKINRAGDDAAGLAISEKMRAQITGLETAQKNAKDGISLVQTAEGALTEVHDMLNRMVELATQSANGTYDNTTDRDQLQKEMNQLKDEINRIADSSNFNGIKLLDGLSGSGRLSTLPVEYGSISSTKGVTLGDVKDGDGSKGVYTITIDKMFTWGDEFKVDGKDADGNDITATLKMDPADGAGKFKGQTVEEQASSIANALAADFGSNFDIKAEGNQVILTSKKEGTEKVPSVTSTAINGTDSDVTITGTYSAAGNKMERTTATTAGASSTSAAAGKYTFNIFGNGTQGTTPAANFEKGDTITLMLKDANGKLMTLSFEATDDMCSAEADKATQAIIDYLNSDDAIFDDNTKEETIKIDVVGGGSATYNRVNTTGVDESKIKFSDLFTASTGATNGVLTLTGVTAVKGFEIGHLQVDRAGQKTAFAATTVTTSYDATSAGGVAQVWEDKVTKNFTTGDKVKYEGTLADGRKFEVELEAGKDFAVDPDTTDTEAINKTVANLGKALMSDSTVVKIKDNDGNVTGTMKGSDLFGDSTSKTAEFKLSGIDGTSDTLTITSAKKGLAVSGTDTAYQASNITKETLTPLADAKVSLTKANPKAQTAAQSSFTVDENLQYGAAIKVGDHTYEIVKDARDTSSRNNTAVVVDDLTNSKAVASAIAAAISGNETAYEANSVNGTVTVSSKKIGSGNAALSLSTPYGDKIKTASFTFDPKAVKEGSVLMFGGNTYEFVKNGGTVSNSGAIAIEVKDPSKASAKELGDAFASVLKNGTITVDDDGKVTLRGAEAEDGTISDPAVTFENNLLLQIGDTADSYNQLKVKLSDMHTAAMGIDGLSIADQDSAAAAIDKIKAAINYVSDVRGTLGATQNRLDHTINNLSVMTENIQDAESTIRDTDVAAEMMQYTKNNILIQSAQAMLAQANQVPQGVLQLLQ